jgi:hypothetical protein
MTTIQTILAELNQVKPCTRQNLYVYLGKLGIKPLGVRQRPQNYPPDTAARVLSHLGFDGSRWMVSRGDLRRAKGSRS